MKSLACILIVIVFISPFVLAAQGEPGSQGQGANEPEKDGEGQGTQTNTETETQNQGEDTNLQNQIRNQARIQNTEQLMNMMQARKQEIEQEMQGLNSKQQGTYRNQNQVRLAVHSLLAMEDLAPGIGPQVSQIAREFNNSVHATIKAEERIQTRSRFARFFSGGDAPAAEELENEATQNRERIRQLNQLREQCQCPEEVKQIMQEQIQNMEQEQTRLQELAQNEKKSKGLFGWIWK